MQPKSLQQRRRGLAVIALIAAGWIMSSPALAPPALGQSTQDRAWQVLHAGISSSHTSMRSAAVRVLGLLREDSSAVDLAGTALRDPKTDVRVAAAEALGELNSRDGIPLLRSALKDRENAVVMAAAHSLSLLGDETGYAVYGAVLTGRRKSGAGLLDEQKAFFTNKKKLAQMGLEEGIAYLPYAGIAYGAMRVLTKDDVSPVRAAAATALAADPDPHTGELLATALSDKSWRVRQAALNAIAKRGDSLLLPDVAARLSDHKYVVRYTAAAAFIELVEIAEAQRQRYNPNTKSMKMR